MLTQAQDSLSLSQVWEQGLANNYDVVIARLEQQVLENNQQYNWLNYSPELAVNGGVTSRTQNVSLTFASGDVQNRDGAGTFSANAGASLTYRVFEGLGKTYRVKVTNLSESQGEYQLESAMEATLATLTNAYYTVVAATNQAKVLESTLDLSRQRVALAEAQYAVGKSSKLEYLQAQVDYNTDSSAWLAQQETVKAAAIQLNVLMARDPMTPVMPFEDIPLDTTLDFEFLRQALASSPTAMIQQIALNQAEINQQAAMVGAFPTLDASVDYGYNYSNAEAGFVLQNQTSGFSGGLTLRWSLSGTLDAMRQRENANLQTQAALASREQTLLNLESNLASVYNTYQNQQAALGLEKENVAVARENASIALERYRLGKSNALQLREAQRNLVEAENRLLSVRYRIKQAEIELLRVSGQLMEGSER